MADPVNLERAGSNHDFRIEIRPGEIRFVHSDGRGMDAVPVGAVLAGLHPEDDEDANVVPALLWTIIAQLGELSAAQRAQAGALVELVKTIKESRAASGPDALAENLRAAMSVAKELGFLPGASATTNRRGEEG